MAVPDRFRLQESRRAALDNSLVKRGVLVRLGMGGGLVASSLARVRSGRKILYDYYCSVHLEAEQRTADFPNLGLPF